MNADFNDCGLKVRSIMPTTEAKFVAQTVEQGYELIDLGKK